MKLKRVSRYTAILILLFISCKNRQHSQQADINTANVFSLSSIDTSVYINIGNRDLGIIYEGEIVEGQIDLKNDQDDPIIVYESKTNCGCLSFDDIAKPIMPKEIVKLSYSYNTRGKVGKQYDYLKLKTSKGKFTVMFESYIKDK